MQSRILVDKSQLLHYRVVLLRLGKLDLAKSHKLGWIETCASGEEVFDAVPLGIWCQVLKAV